MYKIIKNEEFNSIEVSFDEKPSKDVINLLKELKFRWHAVKKVWYGYATEEQVEKALSTGVVETKVPFEISVVVGSWKAYNECNERSLGSKWLKLSQFNTVDELTAELKKEGFTDEELDETFLHDFETEGIDEDILIFSNTDCVTYGQAFEKYQELKKELENKKSVKKDVKEPLILKSFTVIDDFEEKYNIIKNYYDEGYVDSMRYNKDPKYVEYFNKEIIGNNLVLKSSDNLIFILNLDKPSIQSQLWYDDEGECPDNTYINFEQENIHMNFKLDYQLEVKYIFKDEQQYLPQFSKSYVYWEEDQFVRNLTKDEQEDLKKIVDIEKEKYQKRLKAYWKKYQKNIHWSGYWANK